jgi:hypothetical protein
VVVGVCDRALKVMVGVGAILMNAGCRLSTTSRVVTAPM